MWADELIKQYYTWLKDSTDLKKPTKDGWVEVSTPYVGLYNDHISFVMQDKSGKIFISDDGVTISNLKMLGLNTDRASTKKKIDSILDNYNLKKNGKDEVWTECDPALFPAHKHNLLLGLLELNDLEPNIKTSDTEIFSDVVEAYLEEKHPNIAYSKDYIARTKSGIDYIYDFHTISSSEEVLLKTFNKLRKDQIIPFLYSWQDYKKERPVKTRKRIRSLVIVKDDSGSSKIELIRAINNENAGYLPWSLHENDQYSQLLVPTP
jgi:Domain of unknown function DUF1828/Domain of unknown function DUF1829